tara:strand:- start:608 stop:1561 length:954 start_codon:yes stop_codon:yes gene_type:complete
MSNCLCGTVIGNTGVPNCQTLLGVVYNKWMMPTYDSTGVKNYLDLTALQVAIDAGTTDAFFLALMNHADTSKRIYPTAALKDVESSREDPNFQTFKDQSTLFISQGVKNIKGFMPKASYTVLSKLGNYSCNEMSEFTLDRNGNLAGKRILGDTTKMYPRMITGFWDRGNDASADSNVQNVEINYSWNQNEFDADQIILVAGEVPTVDLTNYRGLVDVYMTVSSISTTGFTATMTYSYGTALTPVPYLGAVQADFETPLGNLYNDTDSANVTISTFTATNNVYAFTFAAETSADSLTLSSSKNGFDLSPIEVTKILIP